MLSKVEASLIFRKRFHKTQTEILRLRGVYPEREKRVEPRKLSGLRMTNNRLVESPSGGKLEDFRKRGLL